MSRRPFLAGNWKMFKTGDQAVAFIEEFVPLIGDLTDREAALAVPATALQRAAQAVKGSPVIIGAQNLHWEKEGAFTGEISAEMIVSTGAKMVLIGHSERRQYFGDTDEWVSKKLSAALAAGLLAVICVGETLAERESGRTFEVLATQLKGSLADFKAKDEKNLILAYEPVWAIGTGKTATKEEAQETQAFIRKELGNLGLPAETIRILYGGSVKPENAEALMAQPDIDGLLVGGASLKADSFAKIVKFGK
ncbi:MAG: triose-phosphate isomerase [Deltaproteobacteria bacterium]|jgi:triosephosphate isomerase|nr:triose-phosphate isomerase [Deltaproteobacteria bacterium]